MIILYISKESKDPYIIIILKKWSKDLFICKK